MVSSKRLTYMLEHLLPGNGGDVADFRIPHAKLGGVVEHGMDVEGGAFGFAGELSQTVDELFLELVLDDWMSDLYDVDGSVDLYRQIVLRTEEDDASLRN